MRNWHIALIALLVLCHGPSAGWADGLRPVCPPAAAEDFFYPASVLEPSRPDLDEFVRGWYSAQLAAMREPSLSCNPGQDVYRFLWLRTFQHPIAVRITRSRQTAQLDFVELSGRGGYEPGTVLRRVEKQIPVASLKRLDEALARADFWALPVNSPNDVGFDGSRWVIEGRRANTYHVVDRFTPRDGPFKALGLLFLQLAGIDVPAAEIY